jgi:GABA(A) receptor-associated protein
MISIYLEVQYTISIYCIMRFKKKYNFSERCKESARIMKKYPSRVPIICERGSSENIVPQIDKKKYLVPVDLTMGQFMYVIRKRLTLSPEMGLYIFINEKMPSMTALIGSIHKEDRESDGFLYVRYSGENTFGGK